MERYRVWYTMEGYIDVEAESEDDARSEFNSMTQNELENNLFVGCQIDDIRPQ